MWLSNLAKCLVADTNEQGNYFTIVRKDERSKNSQSVYAPTKLQGQLNFLTTKRLSEYET